MLQLRRRKADRPLQLLHLLQFLQLQLQPSQPSQIHKIAAPSEGDRRHCSTAVPQPPHPDRPGWAGGGTVRCGAVHAASRTDSGRHGSRGSGSCSTLAAAGPTGTSPSRQCWTPAQGPPASSASQPLLHLSCLRCWRCGGGGAVSADDDEEEAEEEELERESGMGKLGCEPAETGWSAKGVSSDACVGTVAIDGSGLAGSGSVRSSQHAATFSVDAMARVGRCGREVDGWIEEMVAGRWGCGGGDRWRRGRWPVVLVSVSVSVSASLSVLRLEMWLALSLALLWCFWCFLRRCSRCSRLSRWATSYFTVSSKNAARPLRNL